MRRLTIRNARAGDVRKIARIGFEAWLDEVSRWADNTNILASQAEAAYRDFAEHSWHVILVGELDGRMAGWGARENSDHMISDLWVAPACQGQGVGSALLEALEQAIREAGHGFATLETHANNTRAIDLYKRHGYGVIALSVRYSRHLDRDVEKVDMEKTL